MVMQRSRLILGLLIGLGLTLCWEMSLATPSEVLLLRHGHKDVERGDSNLSPQGLERMQSLARVIPACFGAPTRIVVYPFNRLNGKNARSYQSVVPLAVNTGAGITVAEAAVEQSEQVGQALLSDPTVEGGRVVMAWEHRRLPALARGLGWIHMPPIVDDDFDRLEVLRYRAGATAPTVERYSQQALINSGCGQGLTGGSRDPGPQVSSSREVANSDPAHGLRLDLNALRTLIGPPPAPGSQKDSEDLVVLRWLQKSRTPLQIASSWILLERDVTIFSAALGLDLSQSTPRLAKWLTTFLHPVNQAKDALKNEYRRPRPFLTHPELIPCLPREQGYSYPSGHSAWYRAASLLLVDLLPDRRERLEWIGRQGGFNRSLCGVHYPSDVRAGDILGEAAARQVIASEAWQRFRRDPEIQKELRTILSIPKESLPPQLH
ncbi:MAG: phosphatase PAP2 family protein [Cyanobacteriota bacterium]